METMITTKPESDGSEHRVAPWWMGPMFLLPLRRLWENPVRLFAPWIRPGDRIVELSCGMGFFSLDLARMIGPEGRLVAVDVQPRVLSWLRRRAESRQLADRMEFRVCGGDDPGVDDLVGTVDVVVAHHVIHETTDPERVIGRLIASLRSGGRFWLAEPVGHVTTERFDWQVSLIEQTGLELEARPQAWRQQIAVFRKP